MMIRAWLRQADKRAQTTAILLFAAATLWSFVRIARSLQMLFGASHDLYTYYSIWFVLLCRDCADIALRQSFYLPHTFVVLTPLFALGWPLARIGMLLINVAAVFYIWFRLSRLAQLEGIRRWLLLVLFCSWLGTGLVLGLGNLALVCLAGALAACPFTSRCNQFFLTLAAMKQSLAFPLYFQLLCKRPKALVLPMVLMGVCGLAALVWTRQSLADGFHIVTGWFHSANGWPEDQVSLLHLLAALLPAKLASALNWGIWLALFVATTRLLKDPLTQVAALLLLSLLPMYHNVYDTIMAAPALAIFLKRGSLGWPVLLTLALATDPANWFGANPSSTVFHLLAVSLRAAYYPVLVLGIFGGLLWLETRQPHAPPQPPAPVEVTAAA